MERIMARDWGLDFSFGELFERPFTDRIVLHHSGTPTDSDLAAPALHRAHQAQGWLGLGYHYSIRKDGAIELGRPRWSIGAHSEDENAHTLGIHICGNFSLAAPTAAQIEAIAMLLANLTHDYAIPLDDEHILGHCDLAATACPGAALMAARPTIIGKAAWYAAQ